jgi:acyl-CoA reductase-like NAD-dependent aldehyde dehydrogenase
MSDLHPAVQEIIQAIATMDEDEVDATLADLRREPEPGYPHEEEAIRAACLARLEELAKE